MTFIRYLFSKKCIEALGFTVLHSLWQAVVLALLTGFLLYLWRKKSAQSRYLLSLSSLFLMMVIGILTFLYYFSKESNSLIVNDLAYEKVYFFKENATSIFDYFHLQMPMVVSVWLMGVCFFSLKFCSSLAYIYHLKNRQLEAVSDFFQEKVNTIAADFQLKNKVECWESRLVNSPLTIGWWKPILLFPIGVINQLSDKELEAVLAHELAHIVRKDFIVNILQNIIEIFFYFNPAIWWLSKQIRTERENACDDVAVAYCDDALIYVKTLVKLQELNLHHNNLSLAMAFSKTPKNALLKRIKRIVHPTTYNNSTMEKFTATAILVISLLLLSFQKPTLQNTQNPVNQSITSIDTLPKTTKIENFDYQNQTLSIKKRNGKVTFLKINGKVIPANEYEKHTALIEKMQQDIPSPPAPPSAPLPPAPPSPPSPPDAPEAPKFDEQKWNKLRFLTSEQTQIFDCSKNLDCPKTDLVEVAYKDAQGFDKSVWFSTDGKLYFPDDLVKTGDEIAFPIYENKYFYGVRKDVGYIYSVAENIDAAKKSIAAYEKNQEMEYKKMEE